MKKCSSAPLIVFLLSFASTYLNAQAKLAVYGTVGGEKPGIVNANGWSTAGTAGLYVGLFNFGPVAISADGRAELASTIKSGLVGPRIALHLPVMPLKPYVEVLVGGSTYPNLPNGIPLKSRFAGRFVAGVDTTILPRIDWRIVDFGYGITAANPRAATLTTGVVVRF
jgi:hypothetical protein